MSSIPSNLARVPNALLSNVLMGTLNRTSGELLNAQLQLTTGRLVNRPSDNAVSASTISVLDDIIERRSQRLRNLDHGEAMLNNLDSALADASDALLEAKSLALSQIGFGADPETRANQAIVVDSILQNLTSIANREYQGVHYFGGTRTAESPMQELLGGLRYGGTGDGLRIDDGQSLSIPITLSADRAFGALSSRISGDRDLDPTLTSDTRIEDLNGARGLGITLGTVMATVGGTDISIDLSAAHTVQDVISELQTQLQTLDPTTSVTIDPLGNRLNINNSVPITIADVPGSSTAVDLGVPFTFPIGATGGLDIDPRITELTPIANLAGITSPLGSIRLTNAGQTRTVDLSGALTVQDLVNAIQSAGLGIRVELAESGDRLNFVNELSGGSMSIGEVAGGQTATQLGVRSFAGATLLSDFNDGRGVDIITGSVDPISGTPDPAADVDFQVTLKDGSTFEVDLAGAVDVQDVIDLTNAAAATAGLGGANAGSNFFARLAPDGNGLQLIDNTAGAGSLTVANANGSRAAEQLGIVGSTTGASLTGTDRATIAADGVFSHLIALRDALAANDETGIEIASERLELDLRRVAEARAEVGVRARRVSGSILRQEDLRIQDMGLRSQVQDLDYTEAAVRFSTLQQQLQAGLTVASQMSTLSLLDFLR